MPTFVSRVCKELSIKPEIEFLFAKFQFIQILLKSIVRKVSKVKILQIALINENFPQCGMRIDIINSFQKFSK